MTVSGYDSRYNIIRNINIKNIYTTNIDDLFFHIFENNDSNKYLNDTMIRGAATQDNNAIEYFSLHGCVRHPQYDYIFGETSIASAFSKISNGNVYDPWPSLRHNAQQTPMLFWGWNFSDSGPLEAMYGENNSVNENITKWILLYNPDPETIDYLESLSFNIIIGDTSDMLDYFINILNKIIPVSGTHKLDKVQSNKLLDQYVFPKKPHSYPFENYFVEFTPQWCYIVNDRIAKTSKYREVLNEILKDRNVLVYGIRGAGKTTLLMQLMKEPMLNNMYEYVHCMKAPSLEQAQRYLRLIKNKRTLLFVDDCFRDTDAILELIKRNNLRLVAFDRDFSYESQAFMIPDKKFKKIDISELKTNESEKIIETIPRRLLRKNYSIKNWKDDPTIPSLFTFILRKNSISFIEKFCNEDKVSAEVFLVICYVHSCGVPCSFDMIYSYLGEKKYSWKEMLDIIDKIGKLIHKCYSIDLNLNFDNQDYYTCRSRIFAEQIIRRLDDKQKILENVLIKFVENVPVHKIPMYDCFKRRAYDADLATKVFRNDIEKGEEFYRLCKRRYETEYVYQQAALYFARHRKYQKAFQWIDQAKNLTHYNRFSIESTYSQIFFDVSIQENSKENAKNALDGLEKCCRKDKRKYIHYAAYAQRVYKFYDKYGVHRVGFHLETALKYLAEGMKSNALSDKNRYKLKVLKEKFDRLYSELSI